MSTSYSRTLLGPLTTTFVPPPECSVYGEQGNAQTADLFYVGQSCEGGAPKDASTCWPTATIKTNAWPLGGFGFYSPGLVCPDGYAPACTSVAPPNGVLSVPSYSNSFNFQYPLTAGETAIGCCPSGLGCERYAYGWQTCVGRVTTGSISVGQCSASGSDTGYEQFTKIKIGTASTSLFGPLVQLVYKSSDSGTFVVATSTSSTSSASTITTSSGSSGSDSTQTGTTARSSMSTSLISSTGTSASSSTGTSSSSSTGTIAGSNAASATSSADTSSGLSSGAKIGIGVGVPLAVILVAALGIFLFLRRRKTSQRDPSSPRYEIGHENRGPMELPSEKAIPISRDPPSYDQRPYEMGTGRAPAVMHELPNTYSPR